MHEIRYGKIERQVQLEWFKGEINSETAEIRREAIDKEETFPGEGRRKIAGFRPTPLRRESARIPRN